MNTFHLCFRSLFRYLWLFCLFLATQTLSLFGQFKVDQVQLRPDGMVELSFQANAGKYYRLLSGTVVTSVKTLEAISLLPPLIAPSSDASIRFFQLQEVSRDAALDSDGDGRDDVAEMLAGTNPLKVDDAMPTVTTLTSSPAHGENDVAVTRETEVSFSQPLAADTQITTANFFAEFGGRKLLSRVEVSSDRRKATIFYLENLPGDSRVRVTFNPDRILDTQGKAVDGDADGMPGGVAVIDFDTLSTIGLRRTGVVGRVFASELAPGPVAGSINVPLKGVTITVDGAEESMRTTTDANGNFKLEPSPAGRFFVHVDGRTAEGSEWPNGPYYPFVGKAWEALPGKPDNLAGGSGEIYLPRVSGNTLKSVSLGADTTITFPPEVIAANPALEGVSLTIQANSLFADNGARGGRVGIAPVPPDRLPEPLPEGLQFPIVITVQTDGPQNLDRPASVRFPNLQDPATGMKLPPGARSALWSFDHDLGTWEIAGGMVVSPDGNFFVNAPGVGIREPGWHGVQPGVQAEGGEIEAECEPTDCALGEITMSPEQFAGRRRFSVPQNHSEGRVNWFGPTAADIQGQGGTVYTAVFCTPGTHTVRAVLSPKCGDSCEQSFTFTINEEEVNVCDPGVVGTLIPSGGYKKGEPVNLTLLSVLLPEIVGDLTWTAPGGTPSSGTGPDIATRYCTPGNHRIDWTVRTPCGKTCKGFEVVTVVDGPCSLEPMTISGDTQVGELFVVSSTAGASGAVTWSTSDASAQVHSDLGPSEVPHTGGEYSVFSGFIFCTPGAKTIRVSLATSCGEVCEQTLNVTVAGATCALDPITLLDEARVGERIVALSKASASGTIKWSTSDSSAKVDSNIGPAEVPHSSGQYDVFSEFIFCTPGLKTIRVQLTTACGEVCEEVLTVDVKDQPCDLDPLVIGIGEAKVGETFVVFSKAYSSGTVSWATDDGTPVQTELGPSEVPYDGGKFAVFAGVQFPTPGLKIVQVTLTTLCGASCNRNLIVDVKPASGAATAAPSALANDFAHLLANFESLRQVSGAGWSTWGQAPTVSDLAFLESLRPSALSPATQAQSAPAKLFTQQKGLHYFLIQNLDTGRIRRGRAGANGIAHARGIALAGDSRYREFILQAGPFRVGTINFTTPQNGERITLQKIRLTEGAQATDSDNDGLPDLAEFIVGTDPVKGDTDLDGISDTQEVRDGTPASLAQAEPLGAIASLKTAGRALDIATANGIAAIADGPAGVAVFNIFSGLSPLLIAQVDTPGSAEAVAIAGNFIAVADGDAGLTIINISDPPAAAIQRRIGLGAPVRAVATAPAGLGSAVAYAGIDGGEIVAVDLESGAILLRSFLSKSVQDIVVGVDFVYVLTLDELVAFSPIEEGLRFVGSLDVRSAYAIPHLHRGRLFAERDRVYATYPQGFLVIDVRNPGPPALLSRISGGEFGWKQVAPLGNGQALAAVGARPVHSDADDISLYDLQPDGTNSVFITTFETPGPAGAFSVFRGLTYVADGDNGLTVIRHLNTDQKKVAPTIRLATRFSDGLAEENKSITVAALAVDDVQVRNVEFYLDGKMIADDGSHPFTARLLTPLRAPGKTGFTLRARAFDTAGNFTDTGDAPFTLVADATPPTVVTTVPNDDYQDLAAPSIGLLFSEPFELNSVQASQFAMRGAGPDRTFNTADDLTVPLGNLTTSEDPPGVLLTTQRLDLPSGRYRITYSGGVTDLAGNVSTQTTDWTFDIPEPSVDDDFPRRSLPSGGFTEARAVFEGRIDPRTITTSSFQVFSEGADGRIGTSDDLLLRDGLLSYDAASRTARISFPYPLMGGEYQVFVRQTIADIAGTPLSRDVNWTFFIESPRIAGTEPVNNTGFEPGTLDRITVLFEQDMSPSTINSDTFQVFAAGPDSLVDTLDDVRLKGVVAYNAATTSAQFFPKAALLPGRYRAVLFKQVSDPAGGLLEKDLKWNFSIRSLDVKWISPNNGAWSEPSNWSSGEVPSENDRVTIDRPGEYLVEISDGARVASLTVGHPEPGLQPTLSIFQPSPVTVIGGITIMPGATLRSSASFGIPQISTPFVDNRGSIDSQSARPVDFLPIGDRMILNNRGVIAASIGSFEFERVDVSNVGELRLQGSGIIRFTEAKIRLGGDEKLNLSGGELSIGGQLILASDLTIPSQGTMSIGAEINGPGSLINLGKLALGPGIDLSGSPRLVAVPIRSSGTLTLADGGYLEPVISEGLLLLDGGIHLSRNGRIENSGQMILRRRVNGQVFVAGGRLDNFGTLSGLNALNLSGLFTPLGPTLFTSPGRIQPGGLPPVDRVDDNVGDLFISGAVPLTDTSVVDIEIRSGSTIDQLFVEGALTCAGTLNISLLDGFLPPLGRKFDVLFGNPVSGQFPTVTGLPIDATREFKVNYLPNSVQLEVVATP